MSSLPGPENLAVLVSNVTRTMCGTTFVPGDPVARGESLYLQMALITLSGDPDIAIVVSSDQKGSRALGRAFFGITDAQLTQPMIDDAIAELLNMVAGQLSSALGSRHRLGLPKRVKVKELAQLGGLGAGAEVLLRSEGAVDLGLWISETAPAPAGASSPGTPRQTSGGLLRALLPRRAR
jgi:hypothetical protein